MSGVKNEDSSDNTNSRGKPTISQLFTGLASSDKLIAAYRAWSFCLLVLDLEWNEKKWQLATTLVPEDMQITLLSYLQSGRLHDPGTFSRISWDVSHSKYINICCDIFKRYKQELVFLSSGAAAAEQSGIQFRQYDIYQTFFSGRCIEPGTISSSEQTTESAPSTHSLITTTSSTRV